MAQQPTPGMTYGQRKADLEATPFLDIRNLAMHAYKGPDGNPIATYKETVAQNMREEIKKRVLDFELANGLIQPDVPGSVPVAMAAPPMAGMPQQPGQIAAHYNQESTQMAAPFIPPGFTPTAPAMPPGMVPMPSPAMPPPMAPAQMAPPPMATAGQMAPPPQPEPPPTAGRRKKAAGSAAAPPPPAPPTVQAQQAPAQFIPPAAPQMAAPAPFTPPGMPQMSAPPPTPVFGGQSAPAAAQAQVDLSPVLVRIDSVGEATGKVGSEVLNLQKQVSELTQLVTTLSTAICHIWASNPGLAQYAQGNNIDLGSPSKLLAFLATVPR